MQKFPSFPFYLGNMVKITVLLFVGVYAWTPYFLVVKAGFVDALLPLESFIFAVISIVCFVWVGFLTLEMLKK